MTVRMNPATKPDDPLWPAIDELAAMLATDDYGVPTDLRKCLENLHQALLVHVDQTEAPLGLLYEMSIEAPQLRGQIDVLRHDHPTFEKELQELLETLDGQVSDWRNGRLKIMKLLSKLSQHRKMGFDLIHDAYYLDIGGLG